MNLLELPGLSARATIGTMRLLAPLADPETAAGFTDRVSRALDDLGDLAVALPELTAAAERIERSATSIATSATTIATAADGIDTHASLIARDAEAIAIALPAVARLVEVLGPLDGTVERLGRIVDRLPGGRRPAREIEASTD